MKITSVKCLILDKEFPYVFVETDDSTGLAVRVEPIRIGGQLSETIPD